jgi:hypothetical protein
MRLIYSPYAFQNDNDRQRNPLQVRYLAIHLVSGDLLPDDFFVPYENLDYLKIYAEKHIDLPPSLFDCKWLRSLEFNTKSQRSIPKAASKAEYLEHISFDNQSYLLCSEMFLTLNKNRNFTRFEWKDFGDTAFPKAISNMSNLTELSIEKGVLEKVDFATLIDVIAQMR